MSAISILHGGKSPAPPMSAARAALAAAICALGAAEAEFGGLRQAGGYGAAAARAEVAAHDAVAAATDGLEAAKREAVDRLIGASCGAAVPAGTTIRAARVELETARDNLDAAQSVRAALTARLVPSAAELERSHARVDAAAVAVLREHAAGQLDLLTAELSELSFRFADKSRLLQFVNLNLDIPKYGPAAHPQMSYLVALFNSLPANWTIGRPGASPSENSLRAALAALKLDAGAALPEMTGTP